jgi:large repetitive protein
VGTSCDEVTPVGPALSQAVCANGVLSAPTLEVSDTDDIKYSVNPQGAYAPGGSVVVTATLRLADVGWPDPLPEGWTKTGPTTATFTVVFDPVVCTPVDPVVVQATCANGAVTAPEVALPTRWALSTCSTQRVPTSVRGTPR